MCWQAFKADTKPSPSMRREWIEITNSAVRISADTKSPSMRREWIEMYADYEPLHNYDSLPPCGGSGLKLFHMKQMFHVKQVSLHAEGVD